ncbi:MAG TPA: hypothetical protein VJ550_04930 [Geomonas sp.]|nr:hypothetical protein [Geomonas sp.]
MKKYKVFARRLALLLAGYFLFNLIAWQLFTGPLVSSPQLGGDLRRMGYISSSKVSRKEEVDLPRKHVEREEYKGGPVDVVTIGDSFSNGGGHGHNPYYQDYIASCSGVNVLNIPEYKKIDKVSTVSLLNNNGYLDRIRPKAVVIECAVKGCLIDLPERYDFDKTVSEQELSHQPVVDFHLAPVNDHSLVKLTFFSEANWKLIRNRIFYRFSDHAYWSPVYRAKLKQPLFSVKEADTLLFYEADVKNRKAINPQNLAKLNDGLNQLADRLSQKGIELYFMPCVDKYDLYRDYLVRPKYDENPFFDELRSLPKRYRLIDTKAILKQELDKGVKDIYFADDTHWNWKASEAIFSRVHIPSGSRPAGK